MLALRCYELLTRRARPDDGLTALALSEVGYSKRNIAFVLEELRMAGIVVSTSEGNRARYRLTDHAALERVLGPIPSAPGRWHFRLPIIAAFVELAADFVNCRCDCPEHRSAQDTGGAETCDLRSRDNDDGSKRDCRDVLARVAELAHRDAIATIRIRPIGWRE